ncbi:MAG: hypothetical protein ABIZ04_16190 [Opitutus sp.]
MGNEPAGNVRTASNVSIAGVLPNAPEDVILAATSTGAEFNTIRQRLIPMACFKLEDNNFEFDSSLMTVRTFDVGPLKDLLDAHPGAKLSIFGHADPSGRDDYNKMLSGRRAQAVFGLLVRDIGLWEDLYFHHDKQTGRDEWGVRSVQSMLNEVGPTKAGNTTGVLDDATKKALNDFEVREGLPAKGFNSRREIEELTFRRLATQYMDVLGLDNSSKIFKLTRNDFLARGAGKDGKGDFQGCSEFNPLLLFSQAEKNRLERDANHPERNARNAPNRRVMILLFRPGSQVDPVKWPCPTVKEGVAGCKLRFFSDGERRRQNSASERIFAKNKDTFACRFYDRLSNTSPCESILARGQGNFDATDVTASDSDAQDNPDSNDEIVVGVSPRIDPDRPVKKRG